MCADDAALAVHIKGTKAIRGGLAADIDSRDGVQVVRCPST